MYLELLWILLLLFSAEQVQKDGQWEGDDGTWERSG